MLFLLYFCLKRVGGLHQLPPDIQTTQSSHSLQPWLRTNSNELFGDIVTGAYYHVGCMLSITQLITRYSNYMETPGTRKKKHQI